MNTQDVIRYDIVIEPEALAFLCPSKSHASCAHLIARELHHKVVAYTSSTVSMLKDFGYIPVTYPECETDAFVQVLDLFYCAEDTRELLHKQMEVYEFCSNELPRLVNTNGLFPTPLSAKQVAATLLNEARLVTVRKEYLAYKKVYADLEIIYIDSLKQTVVLS